MKLKIRVTRNCNCYVLKIVLYCVYISAQCNCGNLSMEISMNSSKCFNWTMLALNFNKYINIKLKRYVERENILK